MNERIKELKRQAWDFVQHDLETVERDHAVMEQEQQAIVDAKFAELIVRECAGVDLYWLNEQDRKAVAEKIKQHFGVE
jgi:cytidylate kinase